MSKRKKPSETAAGRFKRYPEYKDSGVEWPAEIPTHWSLRRLRSSITACQNGVWGEEPDGRHDVACVRVADFDRVGFRVDLGEPTLRAVEPTVAIARGLRSGDLLLEKSGGGENQPVGAVVLYDHETLAVCSNFVARMPVAQGFSPRFLTYLHAALYSARINTRSIKQNTGIQNLDSSSYLSEPVAFPSFAEQRTIAAFLDRETARIDALVAKKERLIELLQEKRSALINGAVTKGLNPEVPMKDSGVEWLGKIPAHWTLVRLGRLATVANGSTPSRGEPEYWYDGYIPWLTSGKINEGTIQHADEFVTDIALKECHLPSVRRGSVLIAITGEGQTRGRAALLGTDATISQHLAAVVPRSHRLRAEYLWRFMQAQYQWLRSESGGAGSTRAALTIEFLKTVPVTVPPEDEQAKVTRTIEVTAKNLDDLIEKVGHAVEGLKELRTALISAAVTGRIDVREGPA